MIMQTLELDENLFRQLDCKVISKKKINWLSSDFYAMVLKFLLKNEIFFSKYLYKNDTKSCVRLWLKIPSNGNRRGFNSLNWDSIYIHVSFQLTNENVGKCFSYVQHMNSTSVEQDIIHLEMSFRIFRNFHFHWEMLAYLWKRRILKDRKTSVVCWLNFVSSLMISEQIAVENILRLVPKILLDEKVCHRILRVIEHLHVCLKF